MSLIDTYVEEFQYDTVERNDSYLIKRGYVYPDDVERVFPELPEKYPRFFEKLCRKIESNFVEWVNDERYS